MTKLGIQVLSKEKKEMTEEEKTLLTLDEFIAGWSAGIGGLLVSHPFDTIKVLQQQGRNKSILRITHELIKTCGISYLYKGVMLPLHTAGINNALCFGAYANSLRFCKVRTRHFGIDTGEYSNIFIAGNIAGFTETIFRTPIDMLKVKMQIDEILYQRKRSLAIIINEVFKEKGVWGFFHGFLPTAIRQTPSGGLFLGFYNYADKKCQKYVSPYWAHCIAGGFAGAVSYAPFQPLDVVKTRLQADSIGQPKYHGFLDCVIKIYKEEGLMCFWRGFYAQNIQTFICNAATFVIYEYCMETLHVIY